MRPLRLVSVNVEWAKHFDRVIPFITGIDPDVLCVQELQERDISHLETELKMMAVFAPMGRLTDLGRDDAELSGIGIFTRQAPVSVISEYYSGSEKQARELPAHCIDTDHPLLTVDVEHSGTTCRIATTHFTWTPDGSASAEQRADMRSLHALLETKGEFVLCGDFNAPRGGEMFAKLANTYVDNIPARYETSIDVEIHRDGKTHGDELLHRMVDGLFTTPGYRAQDVELHFGISDHAAVTALVERT